MIEFCIAISEISQAIYFTELTLTISGLLMFWAFATLDIEESK